jgi:hypothetical protein
LQIQLQPPPLRHRFQKPVTRFVLLHQRLTHLWQALMKATLILPTITWGQLNGVRTRRLLLGHPPVYPRLQPRCGLDRSR